MARKTRKSSKGGSIFSNNSRKKKSSSSSKKKSIEIRKKNLQKIMRGKQIDKLKQEKCVAQYKRCMSVSRRRTH